jgi:2-phospho-L-lactate guanylyltransferase (CobY/MobA/RfbA family)
MPMVSDVVVIPVKSFDVAKDRLRRAGVEDVSVLARDLALGVIDASAPRHIIILSESLDVTVFASEHGLEAIESDAVGLNGAVQHAYDVLGERYDQLIVAHGDLRYPLGLGTFTPAAGVTIVTDHRGTGTNVLVVPTRSHFTFFYGADSATQHRDEAERLGLSYTFVTDSPWRFDVDAPRELPDP